MQGIIDGTFGSPGLLDLSRANFDVGAGTRLRQIGSIDPAEVTVEEMHDDELVITMHPVEQGAIISDHAYKLPPELRVRCAWSNSFAGRPSYAEEVYGSILALQTMRQPFPVWTGKRYYDTMLVAAVRVRTASESEFALLADITLRQIIQVNTSIYNADASSMRIPQATQPTQNSGQQNLQPATLDQTIIDANIPT